MKKIDISFIDKCEKFLLQKLSLEGFTVNSREEIIKEGQKVCLEFIVKDFEFLIADDHASYARKYFNRSFEVYKGYTEDDLINEFTEDCIFFLQNPEMIDKPALFNLKTWIRWVLNGLGWQRPLEKYKKDLEKKRIRKF